MKILIIGMAAAGILTACAQTEITNAEQRARLGEVSLSIRTLKQFRTLLGLADYAQRNAIAYSDAANNIQRNQDIASLAVIGAAGTAVSWAAESVSTGAVGRVATGGVAAQIIGQRYAPEQVIRGVLTGAKRLNCIAFHSHVLDEQRKSKPLLGAVAATRAAIIQVQLKTRESLVREQATFEEIFDEFKKDTTFAEGLQLPQEKDDLKDHIENLQKCVKEAELDGDAESDP